MTFNSHERIFLNFKNHIRLWEIVRLSPSFWSDAKAGRPRPATRSHAREARNVIISQEQIMYSKNIRGKGRVKHKQGSGIKASLALPFLFCLPVVSRTVLVLRAQLSHPITERELGTSLGMASLVVILLWRSLDCCSLYWFVVCFSKGKSLSLNT